MPRFIRAVPVLLAVVSIASALWPRGGDTVPLYAARTGLMCQNCHFDPNGGGPRNDFGFAFARNRHSLEGEDSTSAFHDLNLTNRIGETMPVYLGVNQRFMWITDATQGNLDSLNRAGFFDMETDLHFAFQPHQRITLVYTADGGFGSFKTREAFGMLGGFPLGGYIKVGRFRNPFGLRWDDHTVATRNSFLDLYTNQAFLPYDPRYPDMGVEVGGSNAHWYARGSFTDGGIPNGANPVNGINPYAQTEAIKIGHLLPIYQGMASYYNSYTRVTIPFFSTIQRAQRWGYAGLGHVGPFAFIGEIAAGTDEAPPLPGTASGPKTNLLAGEVEGNWAPVRDLNFRVRYDRLELNRGADQVTKDLNTFNRFAVEGEYVPVPFCELRWAVRLIDPVSEQLKNDTQLLLQAHFSY